MAEAAKILTIEDEPPIRRGIVAYLADSGFTMLEANDGPSGIETFRREHPDVVLCDLRLPGMDGLEVLSTITTESPDTPVIVVSGVSLLNYAVQALKRGAWDYITKPIHDMAVLESAVRRVLEHAELLRQNRQYRENLEELNQELTRTLKQLQEDEEAGRRIQLQMLPEDNKCFGVYTCRRRLFPSMYLSGDFVDYFPIDERHIGFYMTDVSGHGAASAFVTVMINTLMTQYREALWQAGDKTILQPRDTLMRLNRDVYRQNIEKHLTMCYGVIDQAENTLLWSNAGQFPYPMLNDGREVRTLECRGRPIGMFYDAEFTLCQLDLPATFDLVMVSDGILELMPVETLQKRYGELLADSLDGTGLDLKEMTVGLEVLAEKHLPDDIAIMVITRH
jgi:sigma-B regulation protein RsbU (phosphoserine phosphatase)